MPLQAASAFLLAPPRIGDVSTSSRHTLLASARALALLDALLQIPSTLAITRAETVGSLWTIDLQIATYRATPSPLAVLDDTELAAGALGVAGLVAGVAGVVEPLVEPLPHPAMSAPHSAATSTNGDRVALIDVGLVWSLV